MPKTILPGIDAEHHAQVLATVGMLMGMTTLAHIVDALAEQCSTTADAMLPTSAKAAESWDQCAAILLNASLKIKEG